MSLSLDSEDLDLLGYGSRWEDYQLHARTKRTPRTKEQAKAHNAARMRRLYAERRNDPKFRADRAAAVRRFKAKQPPRPYTFPVTVRVTVTAKSQREAKAEALRRVASVLEVMR